MADSKEDRFQSCPWNGDASSWPDYVRRVRLLFEKTRRRNRHRLAPELVSQLSGRAWVVTQEVDHRALVRRDGVIYLLRFLRERLGRTAIPDVGLRLEDLMIRLRRQPGTSIASWATQVRQVYRKVQIALFRARKAAESKYGVSGGSGRTALGESHSSAPSSRRRSQETQEEPLPEEETSPGGQSSRLGEDEGEAEFDDDLEKELEAKGLGRSSKSRRFRRQESDSEDSEHALQDLQMWDAYEEIMEDVLPSEVLGWLLLRRAGLSTAARLAVQASAGNSLRFEDVEHAMRGMEEELTQDEQRRQALHQRPRRTFWMEENGEWATVLADEDEIGEMLEHTEIFHVGAKLPSQVYESSSGMDDGSYQDSSGFWHQETDGSWSWWMDGGDGEFYHHDDHGIYWSWTAYESSFMAELPDEQQKEVAEAFAAAEAKQRSFVEARQAMKAKTLSRGFYPFVPSSKGKPRFKGKGKGSKGKGKGKGVSSSSFSSTSLTNGSVMHTTDIMAMVPGDPSFSGCFICGDKGHAFRDCPKRLRSKGSKGGVKGGSRSFLIDDAPVYMISDGAEYQHEIDPDYTFASAVPNGEFVGSSPEMEGFAVLDTGATETVGSLPALESLLQKRFEIQGSVEELEVRANPGRRFRFGNGLCEHATSHVLLNQTVGSLHLRLGIFTLDVERVPILIGIRTLNKMKAIIDTNRSIAVFAAVDPGLGIPLQKSRSGHLLLNLARDWLEQGFRLDSIPSHILQEPEEEQNFVEDASPVFAVIREEVQAPAQPHEAQCDAVHVSLRDARHGPPADSDVHVTAVAHEHHAHPDGTEAREIRTSMRPATLLPLLTLAALHSHGGSLRDREDQGASVGSRDGVFLGRVINYSPQCQQQGQAGVQGESQDAVSTSGLREGGGSRSAGSSSSGGTVLFQPRGSATGTRVQIRGQLPRNVARLPHVLPEVAVCSSYRSTCPASLARPLELGHPEANPRDPGQGREVGREHQPEGSHDWTGCSREVGGTTPCPGESSQGKGSEAEGCNHDGGSCSYSGQKSHQRSIISGRLRGLADSVPATAGDQCGRDERHSGTQEASRTSGRRVGVCQSTGVEDFDALAVEEAYNLQQAESEALAASLLATKNYSFEACESLLRGADLSAPGPSRSILQSKRAESWVAVLGLFTHGGIVGQTKITIRRPRLCEYLNAFLSAHLPAGQTWTSISIALNMKAVPHTDSNNQDESWNWLLGLGSYTGGDLWLEAHSETFNPEDPSVLSWRSKPDGSKALGHRVETRHRCVGFRPRQLHATSEWTGDRLAILAYTSRGQDRIPDGVRHDLKALKFPLPPAKKRRQKIEEVLETEAGDEGGDMMPIQYVLPDADKAFLVNALENHEKDVQADVQPFCRQVRTDLLEGFSPKVGKSLRLEHTTASI